MVDRKDELSPAELEVLKVLWELGPSTVREVMQQVHANGRRLAYTTILTLLGRLEQKGAVQSDKRGLAHVFKAAANRETVRRSRLKTLVQQLYDGAAAPLVLQLMKTQRFSREEIESLQKLIKELDAKSKQ